MPTGTPVWPRCTIDHAWYCISTGQNDLEWIHPLKAIALEAYKCYVDEDRDYINAMLDPLSKHYDLRGDSPAEQPKVNTLSRGLNTFTYQAAKLWNTLPSDTKGANSIFEFKSLLSKWAGWNAIVANVKVAERSPEWQTFTTISNKAMLRFLYKYDQLNKWSFLVNDCLNKWSISWYNLTMISHFIALGKSLHFMNRMQLC